MRKKNLFFLVLFGLLLVTTVILLAFIDAEAVVHDYVFCAQLLTLLVWVATFVPWSYLWELIIVKIILTFVGVWVAMFFAIRIIQSYTWGHSAVLASMLLGVMAGGTAIIFIAIKIIKAIMDGHQRRTPPAGGQQQGGGGVMTPDNVKYDNLDSHAGFNPSGILFIGLFFGASLPIFVLSGVIQHFFKIPFWMTGIVLLIVFGGVTFWFSMEQVSQNHIVAVEVFGRYRTYWKSGLHFRFPYFGFVQLSPVYLGQQPMNLNMNGNVTTGYGKGHVDFSCGASAPVQITLFYRIVDPYAALYWIAHLKKAIDDTFDEAARRVLEELSLDEAKRQKIKKADIFDKLPDLEGRILNEWGIEISSVAMADIDIPEEVQEARRKVMNAARDAEAAKHEAEKTVIEAKAKKEAEAHLAEQARIKAQGQGDAILFVEGKKAEALDRIGEGVEKQLRRWVDVGLVPSEASALLTERLKWENMGKDNGGGMNVLNVAAQARAGWESGAKPSKGKD